MRVLVIGATGFIGFPVAQALARAGYQVYGLARNDAKAKVLAQNEIIPIIGDATDTKTWAHLVPSLDVVIEAVGGSDVVAVQEAVFNAVRSAASSRPAGSAKISYVYTSGTWVHGDNRHTGQVVTDGTPLTAPAELVAWRPAKEARVLQDDIVNGIVIRPAVLYGKGGSIFDSAFKSASEGKVRWPGPAGGRLSLIHCDDLADLYVRVSERAQVLGGRAFDAANDISESVDDVLAQLVRVSGASGPAELFEPTNVFEKATTTTSLLRPYLARSLVGWQPRKQGLADGMELYYAAWKSLKT